MRDLNILINFVNLQILNAKNFEENLMVCYFESKRNGGGVIRTSKTVGDHMIVQFEDSAGELQFVKIKHCITASNFNSNATTLVDHIRLVLELLKNYLTVFTQAFFWSEI